MSFQGYDLHRNYSKLRLPAKPGITASVWTRRPLQTQHCDQLTDRSCGLLQGGVFVVAELDLDDFLHALGAKFHRHADKQPVDAVLAFEIDGAGENLLLIFKDSFDHFDGRGGRCIVGRTGLQQIHDFGAAFAGALNNGVDAMFRKQIGQGNAGNVGIARQWNHVIAVSAEHKRVDVLHADFALHRDKSAHSRGVEHAGHAEYTVLGEAADLEGSLRHGVERIGHDDDDAVGRMLDDLFDDSFNHVVVGLEQIVAAHAGLARETGGDDDDVATGGG